ncbi:hypothetical protein [Chitinophaga caeni]|nr:hypothetical protein [Chitinophaga caeni]
MTALFLLFTHFFLIKTGQVNENGGDREGNYTYNPMPAAKHEKACHGAC